MTASLPERLPDTFGSTRAGLHTLACFVVAPYRKARTGRIGLVATGGGFGTPLLPDGTRVTVDGDQLVHDPGRSARITTVRAAADTVGLELAADPGVGPDIPTFAPDVDLMVDAAASIALGAWYAFGLAALERLALIASTSSDPQLWPEHFDLAVQVDLGRDLRANVGWSPGDATSEVPYLYVGPHDTSHLDDPFWNASFGAVLTFDELRAASAPGDTADQFVGRGIELLRGS